MFQLTFLGTASGMPTKHRNVSGLAVVCVNPYLSGERQTSKHNRPWVLIDCGEGTQHQLLHTKLSTHQLQAICITHVHGDHCYGLAGLLSSMAMSGRKSALTIVAPKAIKTLLTTLQQTTALYLPFEVDFIDIETVLTTAHASIDLAFSSTHVLKIAITPLSHRVPSYAFTLTQTISRLSLNKDKLIADGIMPSAIWGRLQQGEDVSVSASKLLKSADYTIAESSQSKIVLAGDNDTPELLAEAVKGASLLVHEATHTQAVADKIKARPDSYDPQHTTAKQIAMFAEANAVPNLILTHFSARYMPFDDTTAKVANMGHVREEVIHNFSGKFEDNFWLAKDFDVFNVFNVFGGVGNLSREACCERVNKDE